MYRVAARFSAVALLVLLAACYRYPPPVAVSFPDDPRVLHGEWLMDVRLLEPDVRSFKYVPAHGLLLAWSDEAVYGWQRQPDGSWLEADAAAFAGVRPADYDAALDAFIRFTVNGSGSASVTLVTMPDGAREQVSFSLPAGVTVLNTATGAGRVFVHGRTAASGTRMWWWDARTGEAGGSTAVRNAPDGMKRSRNGSALSFWDLSTLGKGVQVIRTAAPETTVEFSLGICRTTGTGEASTDGRWFAVHECSDRISLADLAAANPGRSLTRA